VGGTEGWILPVWLATLVVLQNIKTINDQKETKHKDYQWSKGNRTQRLSIIKRKQNNKTIIDRHSTTEETKAWKTWTLLKTGMNTGGWHIRMDTSCSTSHARCVTEYKEYQCSKGNSAKRLSMIDIALQRKLKRG
jgi:hypothetical protein